MNLRDRAVRLTRDTAQRLATSSFGRTLAVQLERPQLAPLARVAGGLSRRARLGAADAARTAAFDNVEAMTPLFPSATLPADPATLPRISIVTPNFNQGVFLEECLRSILDQGYPNLELIVTDGGSTDGSVEIIERYADRLTWWVSEKDNGQADAINKGLQRCTGEIFNWINSDDRLTPGALAACAAAYLAAPDKMGWVGGCIRTDEVGTVVDVIYPNGVERENIGENWNGRQFYQPSCFLRTERIKEIGGLDPDLYIALDVDLWLRAFETGELAIGAGIWSTAINHDEAKTQKAVDRMFTEMPALQERFGFVEGAASRRRFLTDNRVDYVVPASLRRSLATLDSAAVPSSADEAKRRDLCLVGDFRDAGDLDALRHFVAEVLPVIRRRHWVGVDVVGTNVAAAKDLAGAANLRLVETAPADLAAVVGRHLLVAVANRDRASSLDPVGVAIRAGVPVVTTTAGAAGYEVRDGVDCFVADHPLELAEKCGQVIGDSFCRSRFARRSRLIQASTAAGIAAEP